MVTFYKPVKKETVKIKTKTFKVSYKLNAAN